MIANPVFLALLSPQERQDLLADMEAQRAALEARLALVAGVSERLGDHRLDGQPTLATWWARRFGAFPSTGRQVAQMAKAALEAHQAPVLALLGEGELCWDQAVQATKLMDLEPGLFAQELPGLDAAQMAKLRRLHAPAPDERDRPDRLRMVFDEESETLAGSFRLSGQAAATVHQALDRATRAEADAAARHGGGAGQADGETGGGTEGAGPEGAAVGGGGAGGAALAGARTGRPAWHELAARGLERICASSLGLDPDRDRASLALLTTAEFLLFGRGRRAEAPGGPALSREELLGLLPGARLEWLVSRPGASPTLGRAGAVPERWRARWLPGAEAGPEITRARPPVTLTIEVPASFLLGAGIAAPPGCAGTLGDHGDGGPHLLPAALRELFESSRVRWVRPRPGGGVGVGRVTKVPPGWLRRLVKRRDRGCRICGRRGWTHLHHIWWWRNGGPTDDRNLAEVCGACHRLLHRPGFRLRGDPRGDDLWLVGADGREHRCRRVLPLPVRRAHEPPAQRAA